MNSPRSAPRKVPFPALLRDLRGIGCLLCAMLQLIPVPAIAQSEAEKLDALRTRIEGLRAKIAEAEESRTEARDQLRDSERAISEASRALRALGGRRATTQRDLDELNKQKDEVARHLAQMRQLVGSLLPDGLD